MKVRLLNREGKWRSNHQLRNEVYRAWQRFEWLLDRERAEFIKGILGEAAKWKETYIRYQDRVCEGDMICHQKVRDAFKAWEESPLYHLGEEMEMIKENLLEMIEDGSIRKQDVVVIEVAIKRIADALPYRRRSKCKY